MVKQGYKQTEIGVIPEDWNCVRFGEKVKIYRGGSPRPIQNFITTSSNGVNWIKIGDVGENDKYIHSTQEKIIPEGVSKSREVHVGDFILSNSMSFGRPYILDIDGCIHDGWLTIQDYKNTFATGYLYYLLSSDQVYQQYLSMAAGSSVKNLNKDKVSALNVIYPKIPEQKRIAEALSDVDSMISSLEKLIAKKKAIKQGAMQELLTGKKRLHGFTGEWTVKYIDDIATIMDNCRIPVKESDREKMAGTIPYCGANGIVGYINGYTIDDEIILIAEDGGYFDEYATRPIAYKMSGKCWVNNHAHILKSKSNTDQNYLFYCLVHKDIRDFISSGTRSKLNKAELLKITIKLPLCLEEQIAIASILSDMDNEIEALEHKLEKMRQIKQGMMQQLLTGKIRLV